MLSHLYLVGGINFNSDYESVIDFDTKEQQHSFFFSKRLTGYPSEAKWVRVENTQINVEIPYLVCQNYSYVMYENEDDLGYKKQYYAFIEDIAYVSPKVTMLTLKLDIWQTYQFDFEIKNAFVEREHTRRFEVLRQTSDYTHEIIYPLNLEDENIELGDTYITQYDKTVEYVDNVVFSSSQKYKLYWYMVISTEPIGEATLNNNAVRVGGIETGYFIYFLPIVLTPSNYNNTYRVANFYEEGTHTLMSSNFRVQDLLKDERIITVRLVPYVPFPYYHQSTIIPHANNPSIEFTLYLHDEYDPSFKDAKSMFSIQSYDGAVGSVIKLNYIDNTLINLNKPPYSTLGKLKRSNVKEVETALLENYVYVGPLTQKLEVKMDLPPYKITQVTNGVIEPYVLNPEYMKDWDTEIHYRFNVGIESKEKIHLYSNLNDGGKFDNVVNAKISEMALSTDPYKRYIENNRATARTGIALDVAKGIAGLGAMAGGIATGGLGIPVAFAGFGVVNSSYENVKGELLKQKDLKQAPDSIKDMGNALEFDIMDNNVTYKKYERRITDYYWDRTYKYFTRYGYKVNELKVPDLRSRTWFNFIKTIDIEIVGNVTNVVKDSIKKMFNRGVTIWHYRDTLKNSFEMYNYDRNNIEVNLL